MKPRKLSLPPGHAYPIDEWRLVETKFYPRLLPQMETLFTTANGYLGIRGCHEEGAPVFQSGTFVNGFYESWPIVYAEEAYGFARKGQTIVNVADSKIINLYIDDEPFLLSKANVLEYKRALDMKSGTLDREVLWETATGKRVLIKSRRFVSFEHKHLALISYEVTVLNAAASIVISSKTIIDTAGQFDKSAEDDPRVARGFEDEILAPKLKEINDKRIILCHTTKNSNIAIASGVDHVFEADSDWSVQGKTSDNYGKVVFSAEVESGKPVRLTKFITYYKASGNNRPEDVKDRAERALDRAVTKGFDGLLATQQEFVGDFWARSDVRIEGDPAVQQAIRFNLFQILQASGRVEGNGLPAKGLTGPGYEGHYFWDTEIYVLPFLIYTSPRIAKNLIRFRYSQLDKARKRAREVNQVGALYPWRTIDGDEASAYYAAGTAAYHINADIVHALRKYVEVTGDEDFLYSDGAEMLVETARLWNDLGFYSKRKGGRFCINGVTGPDEYNTVVDNNTFTNLMARENLWYAARTLKHIKQNMPDRYQALAYETGLKESEIEEWQQAADNMYLCYDERLDIHPQDDSFLDKEPWDLENTPVEKYPLLLHYHPLVIYRHQVIKQADVVLALFLLGDEFTHDEKKRNFDYYDRLTTGDSSLSACIQAIMAAELGYRDLVREYSQYALLMDLADIGNNVKDGCHIASMGGTWMVVVYGFAGLRDYDGKIRFNPVAVGQISRVTFPLTIRGSTIQIDIKKESATYSLIEGEEITIWHGEDEIHLTKAAPVTKRIDHNHGDEADTQL